MPELLTKHPDVVIKILNDAGGICAQGAEQKILTACPAERFCSLPTGELCVYDLSNVAEMTQIKAIELSNAIAGVQTQAQFYSLNSIQLIAIIVVALLLGVLLAAIITKKARK